MAKINVYVPIAGDLRIEKGRLSIENTNTAEACDAAIRLARTDLTALILLTAGVPDNPKYWLKGRKLEMARVMLAYIQKHAIDVAARVRLCFAKVFKTFGEVQAAVRFARTFRKHGDGDEIDTMTFCVKDWQARRVDALAYRGFHTEEGVDFVVLPHRAGWSPWALLEGIKTPRHVAAIRAMQEADTW